MPVVPRAEEWLSNPAGMLRVHQAMPYKLGQCIADLIDNSYDANATKIEIELGLTKEDERMYVLIFDNGNGIPNDRWQDAMTLGLERDRSNTDLGVYGVGLKLSSLSQANEVTAASVHRGEFGLRRLSANHILETGRSEVLMTPTSSQEYNDAYQRMVEDGWSTMVLLEDMHAENRIVDLSSSKSAAFSKEVRRIKVHLGITFEKVLKSKDRGHVELSFMGLPVTPINPFMDWEEDPRYGTVASPTVPISFDSGAKTVHAMVTPMIVPHKKRRLDPKKCGNVEKGYQRANDMQGFYVYRNDRLIQYGGWSGMWATNDEHNKLSKVIIEIPAGTEATFGLSPTKTGIQIPMEFLRRVKDHLDTPREWGQIKRGKKLKYSDASRHRYDNDGKKSKKKSTVSKDTKSEIFNPDSKGKKKRKQKPKPGAVKSYEDDGNLTTVIIDNNAERATVLLEEIRRWKE